MSETKEDRYADQGFGACPDCGGCDGYVNAGRSHWFFCDEHKTMWCAGFNLFSSWHEQTEAEQRAAWHLDSYREVKPINPPVRLEEDSRKIIQDPQGFPMHDDFADSLPF